MINLMGRDKVYTVPEIKALIKNIAGFYIVDELPLLAKAKDGCVYYKRIGSTYVEDDGSVVPMIQAYVKGEDKETGEAVWFTTGQSLNDYNQLKNLPCINGEKFIGNMDEEKARGLLSEDGISGGYDFSIRDGFIEDTVREAFESGYVEIGGSADDDDNDEESSGSGSIGDVLEALKDIKKQLEDKQEQLDRLSSKIEAVHDEIHEKHGDVHGE